MTKIAYITQDFRPRTMKVIDAANRIIAQYEAQGFVLTLRQLYYQFVSRDLLANTQQNYKKLGDILNNARLAGLVSWAALEDRTRNLQTQPHWSSPKDILEAARQSYRIDFWKDQPTAVEVWIEKDALVGVIERVCREYDVPYFACRGYSSQSEQWRAGRRMRDRYRRAGQRTIVLHLGDHDPSGIDMTRDNEARLSMFAQQDVEVRRLALNMDQVLEYGPPPNPAKATDARFEGYLALHGDECWELDALEPTVIAALIEDAINEIKDEAIWEASQEALEADQTRLSELIDSLDE